MSSPNLNNLILSGAILMYLVVVVTGIDRKYVSSTTSRILCNVSKNIMPEEVFRYLQRL